MITTFLSTQSRKAWIAGALSALLTPLLNLLSGSDVLTVRTLVVAIISGLIAAAAVWVTDNADQSSASSEGAATPPATGAVRAATQPAPVVEVDQTTDFPGQSVAGE